MSTPTGDNPRVEKKGTSSRTESASSRPNVNAMSVPSASAPLSTQDMADKFSLDETIDVQQLKYYERQTHLDQRFRYVWTFFCVIAAAGLFVLLLMNFSGLLRSSSISSTDIDRVGLSPARDAALWSLYALEITKARMLLGFLFGALMSVIGVGVIFEGLYKGQGEVRQSISPELARLRQRQAMYRIIPGVVLIVCATILISFSLFSRLPGAPTTPPPADDIQKQQGVNSGSNSRPSP